jgi:hypothetical protein
MSATTTPAPPLATSVRGTRGRHRWVVLGAAAALTLSACGGDAKDEADDEASSPSPSSSPAVETPEGVEATDPGTQLRFGQKAVVDHRVRKQGTMLELTVESARQGLLKDFAGFNLSDPYQRNANYYYVRVAVKNVGEAPLNRVEVPLWGISGDNTLLPAVQFKSSFDKCPTQPTPAKFGPGKAHQTCLVFLSPNKGTLEGVSYRPEVSFDPIEWRGQVRTPVTRPAQKNRNQNNGGGQGGGNNNNRGSNNNND